jgi:GT2 family glycosyltransferase
MASLSFILVNWNCLAFTEQCVAAIDRTVTGLDYEVIVVDNASGDAPCQSLADRFPAVRLILSQENLGFGGANNLAARFASGQILFFLNPDTILLEDAARRAYQVLENRPDAGVVGCRFLNSDGSLQLSSVQAFPSVMNQLLANRWLQQWWPSTQGKEALYVKVPNAVWEVDVVSGAGLLMRKQVFEQVGGFSREYFMYAEEVDLCYRVHSANLKVLHCGDAQVVHFGGQSTRHCEEGYADLAMRESIHQFLLRTQGATSAVLYRAALVVGAAFRVSIVGIALLFLRPRRRRMALMVMRKWRRIARWALAERATKAGSSGPQAVMASPVNIERPSSEGTIS